MKSHHKFVKLIVSRKEFRPLDTNPEKTKIKSYR